VAWFHNVPVFKHHHAFLDSATQGMTNAQLIVDPDREICGSKMVFNGDAQIGRRNML
jgi:hypothetical protein